MFLRVRCRRRKSFDEGEIFPPTEFEREWFEEVGMRRIFFDPWENSILRALVEH